LLRRPLFWADRQVSPTDFISRLHGDAHVLAPDAHAGVSHLINATVGPDGLGGGKRLGVGLAGRGVYGQQHGAFAVVAVHPELEAVQERGVTAPVPFHQHLFLFIFRFVCPSFSLFVSAVI
jgi:hypothetical protein